MKAQVDGVKRMADEAGAWWVKLDGGGLSPQQRSAFEAWLAADPAHRQAFARVERLWGELDALRPSIPPAAASPRNVPPPTPVRKPRPSPSWRWPGLAAALALAVLAGTDPLVDWRADYQAAAGETRLFELPDGSKVQLNSRSALALHDRPDARELELLAGEAWFQVAPDPARPFRVLADGVSATALGTAFEVRRGDDKVEVTVFEHRVAVRGATGVAVDLGEGQRVSVSTRGPGPVERVDPALAGAWRRGLLVFQDEPLGEVVARLNRARRGRILLADPGLADRRVSGVFHTAPPLAAVDALERSLGLRSTRLGEWLVLIHH
ncbi:FecR family protein [Methylomagnum ishizawai]|uniref:FecR family protein n=1 Tax=Methylomagnum ishizawai TaxID=1760988 RepID=A0A1Y6CU78_9GAMM|nr:FecR family protein [Methylomagnum ishizawai]SMF94178.1 FecR family protein [Methylomagnum ishizawai]